MPRCGATLVEMVVVVAILGLLVGLTLSGVQGVRVAAARAHCQNHLRQIGLAWHAHQAAHGYFPTGGGTPIYTPGPITFTQPGSPALGGPLLTDQAAGWMYQILPHLDQEPLWRQAGVPDLATACSNVVGTPVPTYFCPSRSRPRTWAPPEKMIRPLFGPVRAGNDYAGNGGALTAWPNRLGLPPRPFGMFGTQADLVQRGQVVRPTDVTDGLANTLLVADRRLTPDLYVGPNDYNMLGYADTRINETVCVGTNGNDPLLPADDRAAGGLNARAQFGSAHPGGMSGVLADGSVRTISYMVSPAVWVPLCVRNDGLAIPGEY